MATMLDQTDNYKQNALERLMDEGKRLFNLGIESARRNAEKERAERGETTKMIPAQDADFKSYREAFQVLDDDLHFWCEKCEKPLSGHWALPGWWEFCPWCGRKFVATDEARKAVLESRWEKAQKHEAVE